MVDHEPERQEGSLYARAFESFCRLSTGKGMEEKMTPPLDLGKMAEKIISKIKKNFSEKPEEKVWPCEHKSQIWEEHKFCGWCGAKKPDPHSKEQTRSGRSQETAAETPSSEGCNPVQAETLLAESGEDRVLNHTDKEKIADLIERYTVPCKMLNGTYVVAGVESAAVAIMIYLESKGLSVVASLI